MKISEFSPLNKAGSAGRKKPVGSTSATGFLDLLGGVSETESAAASPAAGDIQSLGSVDALLSLQEIPDDELRKRKALAEGADTLEALETLRMSLLGGAVPEHLLHRLTQVVALQKEQVDDPKLKSIIEDIELRAAVELAKLERASSRVS